MKNILIIAVCGFALSSLTAMSMDLPDHVVVNQKQSFSESAATVDFNLTSLRYEAHADYPLAVEVAEHTIAADVDSKSDSMPMYVPTLALDELSHFYKPLLYEQMNYPWHKTALNFTDRSKHQTVKYKEFTDAKFQYISWRPGSKES